jgi:hypothetical protein
MAVNSVIAFARTLWHTCRRGFDEWDHAAVTAARNGAQL